MQFTVQKHVIPDDIIGPLVEYTGAHDDGAHMRQCIDHHGYVLLRDTLDINDVIAARTEVLERLAQVGEVQSPAVDGIATGFSNRRECVQDLNQFWKSVSEGPALRRVTHNGIVLGIMEAIFGEASRPHDLIYLRPAVAGRSTRLHYDYPFFARRSLRIHTAWIPLGDVPTCDGPLLVIEGSNRFDDLIEPIRNHDYENHYSDEVIQRAAYEKPNATDPVTFARERQVRLLTTDFNAGDLIVFGGFTLHGSLDNCSPTNRIRLSCDVRFQPGSDPADDTRYFGDNPTGSHGGGYGDMKGARPLTEPW